ncbi:hypothetical protein AB1Y20_015156 [Prymnesium parvum]|uniref:PDZ domain-containing protein n=1 Tax=Prymnesium parvum TaxID=97485 RepID=A0AB34JXL9_PRYPA
MGLWVCYELRRGAHGLGVDVDGCNAIIELLEHGPAYADGLAQPKDIIEVVDGIALAGRRLVDALAPGQSAYAVTAWRPDGAAMERQARATLGGGTREQPLWLELVTIRRGPTGLGLEIGDFSQVVGLVPQSTAEQDGVIRPGDVISAVDGRRAPLATHGSTLHEEADLSRSSHAGS